MARCPWAGEALVEALTFLHVPRVCVCVRVRERGRVGMKVCV